MKLSNKCHNLFKALLLPALIAAGGALTSCESIFDDQGDCSVHYLLSFRYTKNILDTDAFGSQVSRVNVALYDRNGVMVYKKSEDRALTTENNYKMDIEITPGTYDIIAWCEGESAVAGASSFILDGQNLGDNRTQSGAHLQLDGTAGNYSYSKDINSLYYGSLSGVKFDKDDYGYIDVATIDLTKDTNVFQVLIQSIDGTEINPKEFSFAIEADNSALSYTNAVISTTPFKYTPWSVSTTSASFDKPEGTTGRADGIINGLLAEMTTGRLMAQSTPQLVVRRIPDFTDVIRIDLIKYLLMVKGEYNRPLSDQQYLDRTDRFTLMFFLDSNRNWYTAGGIFINGWRIVPPQEGSL